MKKIVFISIMFCAFTTKAQNLVMNGSFEHNNIVLDPEGDCIADITNASYNLLMDSSSAFSFFGGPSYANCIFFDHCSIFDTIAPDSMAYDGDYSISTHSQDTIKNGVHYQYWQANSLALSQALLPGSYYHLSYYHREMPKIFLTNYGAGAYLIGISEQDTSFGKLVDTIFFNNKHWERIDIIFQATIPAIHLTIKGALGHNLCGALLDNFVLTLDSFAVLGVNEQVVEKQLLYITDVLGRESKPAPNVPLFYRYSDGTVEKKLIIE